MRDYHNLGVTEIVAIIETIESNKLLATFVIENRFDLIVWDVLTFSLSNDTVALATNLVDTWSTLAPDLAKAVAAWNLDYPPDETLFTLIDELIEPITARLN